MSVKLESGSVIAGRYQLERVLGQGGMGTVWEAKHLMTRRLVAMKFLHAALDARPDMRRRFLREAQAAAAVDHPNVVTVHDVFQLDDGMLVLVMARLEGETLAAKLALEAPLSVEETVTLLAPVVSAVGSAHARGVIHRDLKPDNVFLSQENGFTVVRVLDFGIAKLAQHEETGSLTTTGTVLGTPCYMAPEQACGEKSIDHRADVWSLGAMLYESLTGQRPIEGDSLGQIVKLMLTRAIQPIFEIAPGLPSDIAFLVTRMLSIEREDRPSDLREVHQVLSRYARTATPSFGPPISSGPNATVLDPDPGLLATEPAGERPPRRTPAELQVDDLATVPQARQPESWTLLSGGTNDTASAHSLSVAPRRRHRFVFLVMAVALALLLMIAVLQSGSPPSARAPRTASASVAPPLAAVVPAAREAASAEHGSIAAPVHSAEPIAKPASSAFAPALKLVAKPSPKARAKTAEASPPLAPALPVAAPAAPAPPPVPAGVHEAVPF